MEVCHLYISRFGVEFIVRNTIANHETLQVWFESSVVIRFSYVVLVNL